MIASSSSHYGLPNGVSHHHNSTPSNGSSSPQLSLRSVAVEENGQNSSSPFINLQIFIPELQIQKCLTVCLDDLVWDIKRKLFDALSQLKYKKRVYKMLKLDEKALKQLHSKSNLKKFMDYVANRNAEKVEKMCSQGLDPNFHDAQGDTPLTLASGISNNRAVLVQLIGGGAHLDFRNSEGQTGMHKAAFLSIMDNVKTLLELGASPNYRDPIGLTPLYYNMLTTDSHPECSEMLLGEAADIFVQDMHANEPLHQACKNGLAKHVEHLLYYGSNINAQNVNGNTPLHVCAVNNRVDCARVLLFRGADTTIMNKQAQTAIHVAHIVNNLTVAEAIQSHNPRNAAPFVGTPKYNTRRRLTNNQISRRRSLSHSSMCSMQSERYQAPAQLVRPQPMAGKSSNLSPSPSCSTICMGNGGGEYGTLKKYPPEYVQTHSGFEANVPRILVIPRGPKGFGFILRGANQTDSEVDFKPSLATPALQFFEGVETTGMAMRAGLRPGDFLLEINGIDVRCASHEQVVHLIHQTEDTITLKVITIELALPPPSHYGTVGHSTRNHSVPRNTAGLPPMVPSRNPVTSLSFGRSTLSGAFTPEDNYHESNHHHNPAPSNYHPPPSSFSHPPSSEFGGGVSATQNTPGSGQANFTTNNNTEQLRCASVKSRPSPARRISAAELEHLMIRQSTSASQFQPIPYEPDSIKNQGPKKFTSVAEMKRRKQRNSNSTTFAKGEPGSEASEPESRSPFPLKSFNSSPDLQAPDATKGERSDSDYSRPYGRPVLRPKTPPPPPPPGSKMSGRAEKPAIYAPIAQGPPPPQPEIDYNDGPTSEKGNYSVVASNSSSSTAPPPPPPPPPNLFQKPPGAQLPKPTPNGNQASGAEGAKSDCRGISAEALLKVKLKPVVGNAATQNSSPAPSASTSTNPARVAPVTVKKPADFDFDLRNALARRRSKVMSVEEEESSANNSSDEGIRSAPKINKAILPQINTSNLAPVKENSVVVTVGRYGGLSLRESVRENVQGPVKSSGKLQHHSPPGGFSTKKDSGYTSSRTSLEPSECGDEPQHLAPASSNIGVSSSSSSSTTLVDAPANTATHIAADESCASMESSQSPSPPELILSSAGSVHRVAIISQQLEDSYGNAERKGIMAKAAHQETGSAAQMNGQRKNSAGRPLFFENPIRTPAVDYEEYPDHLAEDGNTESDSSKKTHHKKTIEFGNKKLADWNADDVCDWLGNLQLHQYSDNFLANGVTGADLVAFDRTKFTNLGVTMIRHRQTMEQSLRSYSNVLE